MKTGFILSISLVLVFGLMAAPALALYPPCQDLTYTIAYSNDIIPSPTSITYVVTDPVSALQRPDTWYPSKNGLIAIPSIQVDQGILTWIALYFDYTYEVHYRIFDPGRGTWRADHWQVTGINDLQILQHQVHDGVVAWKMQYTYVNNLWVNHTVYYVTYAPSSGSWVMGEQPFDVGPGHPRSPENLRVKEGVVAWPMNPVDWIPVVHFAIFEHELNKWVTGKDDLMLTGDWHLDNVEIWEATVFVDYASTLPFTGETAMYGYDPILYTWGPNQSWTPYHAAFVAQPLTVLQWGWVCFWDTSLKLDAGWRSATRWTFPFGYVTNDVSPVHQFTTAGSYWVYQDIEQSGDHFKAQELVTVDAQPPRPKLHPPGININNGATYTTSRNVILSLFGLGDSVWMRFRNPYYISTRHNNQWLDWESYADSRAWYLDWAYQPVWGPDGTYTVTVQFMDGYGNPSSEYSASIILDTTPPAGSVTLNGGQPSTTNPYVKQDFTCSDANGVAGMRVAYWNAPFTTFLWGPWTSANFYPWGVKFSSYPGEKKIFVQFKDNVGNISQTYEASILLVKPLPFLPLLLLGD